jgi:hypothetical protein
LALLLCAAMGELIKFGFFDGEAHWHQIRYFTNLSNLLGMAYAAAALCAPKADLRVLRGMAVLALGVTAVVFHTLLASVFGPYIFPTLSWWGNQLVHTLTPGLMVGEWLLFRGEKPLRGYHPLIWLGFPAAYFAVTVVIAKLGILMPNSSTPYPYPFLDVWKLGWSCVLRNVMLMGGGFLALGYGLVGADVIRHKREKSW